MTERKALSAGDWLAVGTFLFGTLVAVLMAYGLWTGVGGTAGTGALAAAIAGTLGPWPALVGGVGIALLGARGFLSGDRGGLALGILGVAGVTIGLSVVAGSLSAVRGGSLGAGSGGRVADMTHPAVGVVLGAMVAFGAAYFAWMREDPAAAAKLAPARRMTPAPPRSDDGVTAAESAMLFSDERAAVAAPERAKSKPVPRQAPYPEDVRKKGEIPAGTVPLTQAGARTAPPTVPATAEPAVYRWTAPRSPAADPTHVGAEEIEALADVAPPIPEPEPIEEEELEEAVVAEIEADELEPAQFEALEDDEEVAVTPLPPRPSWETTGLAEDDEPVDAYGTPISLVERARTERGVDAEAEASAEEEVEAELDEELVARIPREIGADDDEVEAREDEDSPEAAVEVLASVIEEDLDAGAEEDAERDEDVDAVAESDRAADVEEEQVLEPAEVETISLLDELRAINAEARAAAEENDADDAEIEAEAVAEEAELEEAVLVEDELVETVVVLEPEPELEPEVVAAAIDEPVVEPARPPEPAPTPARAKPAPAAASLFDGIDTEPASQFDGVDGGPASQIDRVDGEPASQIDRVEAEPDVVLQPQAAVPASRAEKAPARGIDPEKKLLAEVGCMFVERGRVAVSMLQRQYDMDFDQACRVLDDLQELGLIGPYMGGKNREILLSRDAWLEKVGAN